MSRYLYNPTTEDIKVDSDKYGENPETHTLHAGGIEEFEDHIADLIAEKLANKILWDNLPGDRNRDKRLKEIYAIIEVTDADTKSK